MGRATALRRSHPAGLRVEAEVAVVADAAATDLLREPPPDVDQPFVAVIVCHWRRDPVGDPRPGGDVCGQPEHRTWAGCWSRFRHGHRGRNLVPPGCSGSGNFGTAGLFGGGVSVR